MAADDDGTEWSGVNAKPSQAEMPKPDPRARQMARTVAKDSAARDSIGGQGLHGAFPRFMVR